MSANETTQGVENTSEDPWILQVFASGTQQPEISLVRTSNVHGRRSHGWFNPISKLELWSGRLNEFTEAQITAAGQRYCDLLNGVEFQTRTAAQRDVIRELRAALERVAHCDDTVLRGEDYLEQIQGRISKAVEIAETALAKSKEVLP